MLEPNAQPVEWHVPSREDFLRFVETRMGDCLAEVEGERRGMFRRMGYGVLILVGIAAVAMTVGTLLDAQPNVLRFIVGALTVIGTIAVCYSFAEQYKAGYKMRLVPPLVRCFGEDFKYAPDSYVDSARYWGSQIFRVGFDRYTGEDHIHGTAGRTRFEFSEICAQYETEGKDSDGNRETQYKTIFSGLFFVADFNKSFKGDVFVFPDKLERKLGWLAHKLQERDADRPGQLVKLEDPEFEKLFVVYADDQVTARYVLSTSLMKRLTDYRLKMKRPVWLSFRDGTLHVAMGRGKTELFEPRYFTRIDRQECLRIYDDLRIVLDVIEDLNLNTRIWSKQ